MAKKKKKNKQPAKKQNRGTILKIGEQMVMSSNKKNISINECKELIIAKLIEDKNTKEEKYIEDLLKGEYESNQIIFNNKNFEYENKNKFLDFLTKEIFFTKKYNSKEKKDKIVSIFSNGFLPNDTFKKINNIDKLKNIENLNIKINKYLLFELPIKIIDKKVIESNDLRFVYFDAYCIPQTTKKYIDRYYKLLNDKPSFTVSTNWRLAIGLGSASVYETSLTLHHIYGVPYIPASAIKGNFRSYVIYKYFVDELSRYEDNYAKFEEEVLFKNDAFKAIFGTNESQGNLIFYDAFSTNVKIQKDIMNVHYPDYYSKDKPPSDTQNPNPIAFLTVNGKYQFVYQIIDDKDIKLKDFEGKLSQFIEAELQHSLKNFGIGAKNAVGYGYFQ